MRIPSSLPQFAYTQALCIVAGKQDAAVYEMRNGFIEKVLDIKVPKPHYSDNEGHFKVRVGGKTVRSGSVREIRDDDIIRDFLHALKEGIQPLSHRSYAEVYVCAPAKTKNKLTQALPYHWERAVVQVIEGNFYYRNPLYVLERIAKLQEDTFRPARKEEAKILRRAAQAEEVVRTKDHL